MSDQISWQVELQLKRELREPFEVLTKQMVDVAQTEAGTVIYERFIGDDGETIWLYERYVNCAAAVAHLRMFAKQFGERFNRMVTRKRFTVLGSPSDELRGVLEEFDPEYLTRLAGFDAQANRARSVRNNDSRQPK